jgi:hypothetical protein
MKLRLIVGDNLLRSIITNIRSKVPNLFWLWSMMYIVVLYLYLIPPIEITWSYSYICYLCIVDSWTISCRDQMVNRSPQTLSKCEAFEWGDIDLSLGVNYCLHEVVILFAPGRHFNFILSS